MKSILIVIIVLAALFFFGLGIYMEQQRKKLLRLWAQRKRLSYSSNRDYGLKDRFPGLKCLRRGHSRYAKNVMEGNLEGFPVTAFDYHYTTGHGKNRQNHRFSAIIVHCDVPLQPLFIRREHLFDKVGEFLGMDDIDFESSEFSRKFYVKAKDKRWAFDVIHQRMMDYLLTAPDFSLQFDFMHILAYRRKRFDPEDFEQAVTLIKGILIRLPEYVVRQQSGGKKKTISGSQTPI